MKVYRERSHFVTEEWIIVAIKGRLWKGYIEKNGIPDATWFKGRHVPVKEMFDFLDSLEALGVDGEHSNRYKFVIENVAKTWVALNNRRRK